MVVQVDGPDEIANAISKRGQELLAVTESLPEQPGSPEPAKASVAKEAERLILGLLVAHGVPESTVRKMKTEAWLISPDKLVVTSNGTLEAMSEDEDFHALLVIATRKGDVYQPIFVEYQRTAGERESQYCSVHFLDGLNVFTASPAFHIFVQYRCYEGIAYGVYWPDGGKVYVGPYYGL